jgi:hypothetical protein
MKLTPSIVLRKQLKRHNSIPMKTIYTSQLTSTMKNVIIALAFLSFTHLASAQQKMGTGLVGSASLIQDAYNPILSFSPVYNGGKTYVRWLVSNDEKDGIFIIERSADGVDFEALGFKDRVGSPLCVNLFYSFVDEAPNPGQNYYRVMTVGTDQTYTYSDIIRVNSGVPEASNPSNAALNEIPESK